MQSIHADNVTYSTLFAKRGKMREGRSGYIRKTVQQNNAMGETKSNAFIYTTLHEVDRGHESHEPDSRRRLYMAARPGKID